MKTSASKGFILILAIFFIALIELMAISVALRVPQSVRGTMRYEEDVAAQLAADAGIQDTIARLEKQLEDDVEPTDIANPTLTFTGNLNGFQWQVDVEPDSLTYPNGNHSCRCYVLNAQAWRSSYRHHRRVVVSQEPFTKYARFMDRWANPQPAGEDVYFWAGRIRVDGPVHSNEHLWIMAEPSFYSGSEEFQVLFNTRQVSCVDGPIYAAGAPANDVQRRMLYTRTEPSRTPRIVEKIPMPTMGSLPLHAWGGDPGTPAAGLYARPQGGIYVRGDVDELELVDNGGRAEQRFRLGGDTYVLLENGAATTLTHNGTPQTVGERNGLIYVDGTIRSLRGTNVGNHTLAVNAGTTNEITIAGNVFSNGSLGLVTYFLRIPAESVLPRDYSNPVQLQAALYAVGHDGDGGFQVTDIGVGGAGKLEITGCVIEGRRRRCAQVSTNTGWNVEVRHNRALILNPPPFFPAVPRLTVRATRQ